MRLALFAEMVRRRPWTPETLRSLGGVEGIGVTFLEETFSAPTAPPAHRLHQRAAQAVLQALLPDAGSDIKGPMRSEVALREASGYASRPEDFADLIMILDSELRLITPADPEGAAIENAAAHADAQRYYQLTHDYLVLALRNWLTRKQRATRRGRAELILAERASIWNARPENRQLPSILEWVSILWFTRRTAWSPREKRMMRRAGQYYGLRAIIAGVLIAMMVLFARYARRREIDPREHQKANIHKTEAESK